MANLQSMIERCNPYAQLFKFVKDAAQDAPNFTLKFTLENAFDQRRYNEPTANEVAAVFVSEDGAPPGQHTFVIHYKHSRTLTSLQPKSSLGSYVLSADIPMWRHRVETRYATRGHSQDGNSTDDHSAAILRLPPGCQRKLQSSAFIGEAISTIRSRQLC